MQIRDERPEAEPLAERTIEEQRRFDGGAATWTVPGPGGQIRDWQGSVISGLAIGAVKASGGCPSRLST